MAAAAPAPTLCGPAGSAERARTQTAARSITSFYCEGTPDCTRCSAQPRARSFVHVADAPTWKVLAVGTD